MSRHITVVSAPNPRDTTMDMIADRVDCDLRIWTVSEAVDKVLRRAQTAPFDRVDIVGHTWRDPSSRIGGMLIGKPMEAGFLPDHCLGGPDGYGVRLLDELRGALVAGGQVRLLGCKAGGVFEERFIAEMSSVESTLLALAEPVVYTANFDRQGCTLPDEAFTLWMGGKRKAAGDAAAAPPPSALPPAAFSGLRPAPPLLRPYARLAVSMDAASASRLLEMLALSTVQPGAILAAPEVRLSLDVGAGLEERFAEVLVGGELLRTYRATPQQGEFTYQSEIYAVTDPSALWDLVMEGE